MVYKGFSQQEGIDYTETLSHAAKMYSIRPIISLATPFGLEFHQIDVKNAFLHGDMIEETYMDKPLGFENDSNLVCQLKKSLYELK